MRKPRRAARFDPLVDNVGTSSTASLAGATWVDPDTIFVAHSKEARLRTPAMAEEGRSERRLWFDQVQPAGMFSLWSDPPVHVELGMGQMADATIHAASTPAAAMASLPGKSGSNEAIVMATGDV